MNGYLETSNGSKCYPKYSSDCIEWVGASIPCLGVCKGDSLTKMQTIIANKVCALEAKVNMQPIVIPDALKAAFGANDKTILTLFQFALDQIASLQMTVEEMNTVIASFDPQFCLNYSCIGDVCMTSNCLALSVHLQNILGYICQNKSNITALQNEVSSQGALIESMQAQIADLFVRVTNLENA